MVFQASSHFLWLYSPVIGLGYSHHAAHLILILTLSISDAALSYLQLSVITKNVLYWCLIQATEQMGPISLE